MIDVLINTCIDEDVFYYLKQFYSKLKDVLLDKRGWSSKGYNFIFVSPSIFKLNNTVNKNKLKVNVRLTTNDTIAKECKFDKKKVLSCYNPNTNPADVLINFERWMHGSEKSGLKLSDYRIYVINHEIGHALGKMHVRKCTCPTCPVPVMMQQTLSIGECLPNPWPLDNE